MQRDLVYDKLTPREQQDIQLIELLLESYFNVVRGNVKDMIPKMIMLCMVNETRNLSQQLFLNLLQGTRVFG